MSFPLHSLNKFDDDVFVNSALLKTRSPLDVIIPDILSGIFSSLVWLLTFLEVRGKAVEEAAGGK